MERRTLIIGAVAGGIGLGEPLAGLAHRHQRAVEVVAGAPERAEAEFAGDAQWEQRLDLTAVAPAGLLGPAGSAPGSPT